MLGSQSALPKYIVSLQTYQQTRMSRRIVDCTRPFNRISTLGTDRFGTRSATIESFPTGLNASDRNERAHKLYKPRKECASSASDLGPLTTRLVHLDALSAPRCKHTSNASA